MYVNLYSITHCHITNNFQPVIRVLDIKSCIHEEEKVRQFFRVIAFLASILGWLSVLLFVVDLIGGDYSNLVSWTKYRHIVFMEPYRAKMKAIIQKVGFDYNIDIVELEIPEDHIHMVVRSAPKQPPSNVIQLIKSITAREFFRIYPEIKKKYF